MTPRKRHDGTEIDSVKSLAEFVQAIPPSSSEPAETPEATPPAPIQIQAPTGYEGKTPDQIIAEASTYRDRATQLEQQNATTTRELQELRQQRQIDAAARQAVADQQTRNAPPPQPPPPDPREAKIDELWFSDPGEARRLQREIDDERVQQRIDAARGKIREEITSEQAIASQREKGAYAYTESRRRLLAKGVPEADLDNRFKVAAVYTAITMPSKPDAPNPYYDAGGPLSAEVVERAWGDMFGVPQAATPQPAAIFQPPPPVIVAPPGSSRPSPAAAAPRADRAAPVSADRQRDLKHIAEQFGYDPDKLIERSRARAAKEKS